MLATRRAALAAALATPLMGRAQAQQKWQMACPYPDSNFHTRNIREWLAGMEASSGGRVSVQLHSNGSLLPMPQIKRGVQQGQVQLGEILLANNEIDDVVDSVRLNCRHPDLKDVATVQAQTRKIGLALDALFQFEAIPAPA